MYLLDLTMTKTTKAATSSKHCDTFTRRGA